MLSKHGFRCSAPSCFCNQACCSVSPEAYFEHGCIPPWHIIVAMGLQSGSIQRRAWTHVKAPYKQYLVFKKPNDIHQNSSFSHAQTSTTPCSITTTAPSSSCMLFDEGVTQIPSALLVVVSWQSTTIHILLLLSQQDLLPHYPPKSNFLAPPRDCHKSCSVLVCRNQRQGC